MRVSFDGNIYRVSRVTGPSHNFLAIAVSHSMPERIGVKAHRINEEPAVVEESKILQAVTGSFRQRSEETGISIWPCRVEYVASDTADYETYKRLSEAVFNQAAEGDLEV